MEPRAPPCPSCLLGTERGRQLDSARLWWCQTRVETGENFFCSGQLERKHNFCPAQPCWVWGCWGCSDKIHLCRAQEMSRAWCSERRPGFPRKVQGFRKWNPSAHLWVKNWNEMGYKVHSSSFLAVLSALSQVCSSIPCWAQGLCPDLPSQGLNNSGSWAASERCCKTDLGNWGCALGVLNK